MSVIYKYEFDLYHVGKIATITMPGGARVLYVGVQRPGFICLWAMVDANAKPVSRTFRVYGTGHPMDEPANHYLGTCMDGPYVWHVFEVGGAERGTT